MKVKLKKLKDQVIVITGASSGIGLSTARMAAARGARLVLAARNESELRNICDEIGRSGGQASFFLGAAHPGRALHPSGSSRAGTCLCHGVPAHSSRSSAARPRPSPPT